MLLPKLLAVNKRRGKQSGCSTHMPDNNRAMKSITDDNKVNLRVGMVMNKIMITIMIFSQANLKN